LEMLVNGRFELHGGQNLQQNFLVWSVKFVFFLEENPIRCDFLLFRLVVWLVVICTTFRDVCHPKK